MNIDFNNDSHKRYNILTGEWVLVSPHRSKRPWQGKTEEQNNQKRLPYDANCYLCSGNTRVGGEQNPHYTDTYVFDNDFAALQKDIIPHQFEEGLLKAESVKGICRVICFSPNHALTLAEMDQLSIRKVVDTWIEQFEELSSYKDINYVQIFENKGAIMGCSNPHPHGQIWAESTIPQIIQQKTSHQKEHYINKENSLLFDYLQEEIQAQERIIKENKHFVALVPFWAIWPYEVMIIPKRKMANINEMNDFEKDDFSEMMRIINVKMDNIFECSFPYSAGFHQAPCNGKKHPEWHWHYVFYPPLLRSATVKKFMVGYEMLANPQRDITAEQAAKKLREMEEIKYK